MHLGINLSELTKVHALWYPTTYLIHPWVRGDHKNDTLCRCLSMSRRLRLTPSVMLSTLQRLQALTGRGEHQAWAPVWAEWSFGSTKVQLEPLRLVTSVH